MFENLLGILTKRYELGGHGLSHGYNMGFRRGITSSIGNNIRVNT